MDLPLKMRGKACKLGCMSAVDEQKNKKIDAIKQRHVGRLIELKKRRDNIISNFVEVLRQEKLAEIKKSIQR